jgi:uncharacterized protein YjbJ (UPF0337 family)
VKAKSFLVTTLGRDSHDLGASGPLRQSDEEERMGNPIEDVKGKAKEAAGAVTDSASLKREGQAQQDKSDAQEDAARAQNRADAAEREQRANQ